VASPRVRSDGKRRFEDAEQGKHCERQVGVGEVVANQVVLLRVDEKSGDELTGGLHHLVVGIPKSPQVSRVLGLIGAGRLQEPFESSASR